MIENSRENLNHEEIVNIPILSGRVSKDTALYNILVKNSDLIIRTKNILYRLKDSNEIHETIIKECINESSIINFRNTLAKYFVASLFKNNGCKIKEIEIKGQKGKNKTDIFCVYQSTNLLIEVKHINVTNYEL